MLSFRAWEIRTSQVDIPEKKLDARGQKIVSERENIFKKSLGRTKLDK